MVTKEIEKYLRILTNEGDRYSVSFIDDRSKKLRQFKVVENHEIPEFLNSAKKTEGIFIAPNPVTQNTRSEKTLARLDWLFIDIDDFSKDDIFDELKKTGVPEPTLITKRDAKHIHLYWRIGAEATTENIKKYKVIASRFVKTLDGDSTVTSPAFNIRIPGTEQRKTGESGKYTIIYESGVSYNIDDLYNTFKPDQNETDQKQKKKQNTIITDKEVFDFLANQYKRYGKKQRGQGRSRFLFFVGLDCHKWGIDETDAVEFADNVNSLINDPPENDTVVKHQVASAYRYSKEEFGVKRSEAATDDEELNKYKNEIRIREILREWVFISSNDRLYNLRTGMELTTLSQIDNYVAHTCSTDMRFRAMLKRNLVRVVDKIDFRPDIQKRIFKDSNGTTTLNRFSRLTIYDNNEYTQDEKTIEVFTNHLKYLTNTESEYQAVLNFLAYIVQNPGEKLPYALLIISKYHGIGKSMLETLFRSIFRSETGSSYVGNLENEQIAGNYTHYLADRIICFIHELSQGDKYNAMNKFKNLITENTLEINAKYAKPYTIKNTVNFIMFSNDPGAIKIDKHDRRLLVIYHDRLPKEQEYYTVLYEALSDNYMDVYNYLCDRDLSDFSPHKRPEMTDGKKQLIQQSESELDLYMDYLLENEEGPFSEKFIYVPDVIYDAETNGPPILQRKVSAKAVKNFLIQNDFRSEKPFIRHRGKVVNRTIWFRNGLEPGREEIKEFLLKDEREPEDE